MIAEWLEEIAGSEPIEVVVIGRHDNDSFLGDRKPFNDAPIGKILTWEQAKPFLRYEFHSGFGGADCHPVFAWTPTRIIAIAEYDGSTSPMWLPRNPTAVEPGFTGAE
jgi:hypothetical protein